MFIKSNFIPIEFFNKYTLSKFQDKPISIFSDYVPSLEELQINPYNILLIQEPNELFGLHDWAIANSRHFSCILTWGQTILDSCENSLLFPFGTTFLHSKDEYKQLASYNKKLEISFMCGTKQITEGHHTRHRLYNRRSEITVPTNWLFSGNKKTCFTEAMYHLVVENTKNKNYFTEKLIDSLITKTVPIYWGCPNISEFFDVRGIYAFSSEDEAIAIMNSLSEEDYHSKKEYIEKNYERSIYYAEIFTRLYDVLQQIVDLNDLNKYTSSTLKTNSSR